MGASGAFSGELKAVNASEGKPVSTHGAPAKFIALTSIRNDKTR